MIPLTIRTLMFNPALFRFLRIVIFLALVWGQIPAQQLSNIRRITIPFSPGDTVTVDTLSIVPGSFHAFLTDGRSIPDPEWLEVNFNDAMILMNAPLDIATPDSVVVMYRVFPIMFSEPVFNRDRNVIEKDYSGLYNPFAYQEGAVQPSFFQTSGLNKNGNISRGISFGNNQDVVVNSNFYLQLSGKLSDDVTINAAITDNNIPVQPDGNTQQIQDFDQVFIKLSKGRSSLLAGDFEIGRPKSYFMNYFKKGQGAVIASEYNIRGSDGPLMSTTVSGSISKGKFARNIIQGVESNQGPYRLTGSENETFIIVLSGTEKVFIDGIQMRRGENFDYVIDYNTAEITFMPSVPITKDKRIVVEFQYSDKNFSRTLFLLNQGYKSERLTLNANIYSEQDSKNQPVNQDLGDFEKKLLADVGDSTFLAVVPNIDSVEYNSSEVLYEKTDSLGYTVYVYSTDSTKAFYRLGFSYLGPNRGNYIPQSTSANGRVFQWVVPLNGVPQGSYEPVVQLISPKRQSMVTLGGEYSIKEGSRVFFETAYTNYDINLFSDKDKGNDHGYAINAGFDNDFMLRNDSARKLILTAGAQIEHVNKYFVPIENYRSLEFIRDWNLTTGNYFGDENIGSLSLKLSDPGKLMIGYTFRTFVKGNDYTGIMNTIKANIISPGWKLNSMASVLYTDADNAKTNFIRSLTDLSRSFGPIRLGVIYDQEHNEIEDPMTGNLFDQSRAYDALRIYLSSADTAKFRFRVDGGRRYDRAVKEDRFRESTVADELTGNIEWIASRKSRLKLTSNYRNLEISDTILTAAIPEQTFLNRLEYNVILFKGMITSQTLYEVGTGQELKREYAFVEVAPGTGTHTYAGDYNGNGIKDLDEFEIANFSDEADYIKVFLPTNEYVKSRTNQFGEVLTISPAALIKQKGGWGKLITKFTNSTSYRIENKTVDEDFSQSLNPFANRLQDTTLLSTSSIFRNTLAFNRSNTVFGIDFTILNNRNKSLLTNGFESRSIGSYLFNTRWNITKIYSIQLKNEFGEKTNRSEFFSTRDYNIRFNEIEPKFNIQPGISFRATFIYKYVGKENVIGDVGEKSDQHTGGIELRYSSVKKGIASARFNIIRIGYNAGSNTPIAYEILDGLAEGTNFTWGLSLQRNLSKHIQVNLNYDGRKSEGVSPIHIGSVQARAYF